MRKSLLDIVQDILSDMSSDEVNSIFETTESEQVAAIVRSTYLEMMTNRNWPHLKRLTQFDHVNDLNKPTYLKAQENLKEVEQFNYECYNTNSNQLKLKQIYFKHPDEFLAIVNRRNPTSDNVTIIEDFGNTKIFVYNNQDPTYWTTFDDEYIVCDSYDMSRDDTLKASKTQVLCYIHPTWVHEDDHIPDIPVEAFPALIEEAKSTAFFVVKQAVNQKAEQKANRQQRWLSRKAWKLQGGVRYPDYGRKNRR